MLKLGKRKVALLSGCFCLLFSLCPVPVASGRLILLEASGEPIDVVAGLGPELAATSRLSPRPNRPPKALRVPPTEGCVWGCGVLGPAPGVSNSPRGSKSDFAPPPTTAAISRRRFDKVGFAGGGGGLRIPFVGGLGRLGAGDRGGGAVSASTSSLNAGPKAVLTSETSVTSGAGVGVVEAADVGGSVGTTGVASSTGLGSSTTSVAFSTGETLDSLSSPAMLTAALSVVAITAVVVAIVVWSDNGRTVYAQGWPRLS
jgi:hypothetical protein